jgi:hypothetical protein
LPAAMGNKDDKTEPATEHRKHKKSGKRKVSKADLYDNFSHSVPKVVALQLICATTIVAAFWVLLPWMDLNLTQRPLDSIEMLVVRSSLHELNSPVP